MFRGQQSTTLNPQFGKFNLQSNKSGTSQNLFRRPPINRLNSEQNSNVHFGHFMASPEKDSAKKANVGTASVIRTNTNVTASATIVVPKDKVGKMKILRPNQVKIKTFVNPEC